MLKPLFFASVAAALALTMGYADQPQGKLTIPALENIRHAASVSVKKREIKPGASQEPHSAEYGASPIPQ